MKPHDMLPVEISSTKPLFDLWKDSNSDGPLLRPESLFEAPSNEDLMRSLFKFSFQDNEDYFPRSANHEPLKQLLKYWLQDQESIVHLDNLNMVNTIFQLYRHIQSIKKIKNSSLLFNWSAKQTYHYFQNEQKEFFSFAEEEQQQLFENALHEAIPNLDKSLLESSSASDFLKVIGNELLENFDPDLNNKEIKYFYIKEDFHQLLRKHFRGLTDFLDSTKKGNRIKKHFFISKISSFFKNKTDLKILMNDFGVDYTKKWFETEQVTPKNLGITEIRFNIAPEEKNDAKKSSSFSLIMMAISGELIEKNNHLKQVVQDIDNACATLNSLANKCFCFVTLTQESPSYASIFNTLEQSKQHQWAKICSELKLNPRTAQTIYTVTKKISSFLKEQHVPASQIRLMLPKLIQIEVFSDNYLATTELLNSADPVRQPPCENSCQKAKSRFIELCESIGTQVIQDLELEEKSPTASYEKPNLIRQMSELTPSKEPVIVEFIDQVLEPAIFEQANHLIKEFHSKEAYNDQKTRMQLKK